MCFAEEKAGSVYGAPARWGDGEALDVAVELKKQTQIRLMRAGAARYLIQNIIFSVTLLSLQSKIHYILLYFKVHKVSLV